MYELTVDSSFSAAHLLREYDGVCSRLHGHSWKVTVTVGVHAVDALGMGMDFKEIASMLDGIVDRFDHRNLNDLDEFSTVNPTAENLARIIYCRIVEQIESGDVSVLSVTVAESDRYRVTYRKDQETS